MFTQGDAVMSAVAVEHLERAWLGDADWREGPLGWPLPRRTTNTDWMGGLAALTLPLRALGVDALHRYAAASWLGLLASALAVAALARAALGPGLHVAVAGVAGGLSTVAIAHAPHANLVHHEGAALAALAIGAGFTARRPALAALGGLLAVASAHFGVYVGLHALFAAAIAALATARSAGRREGLAALAGAAVGAATIAPVAALYLAAAADPGVAPTAAELAGESVDLARLLSPVPDAALHRPLLAVWPPPPRPTLDPPNPGYLAAALALVGATRARDRAVRWALVAFVAAALLALGPTLVVGDRATGVPGPYRLLLAVGLDALRAPSRWLAVAFLALGLVAAAGARALAERSGRPRLVYAAIIAGLVAELPSVRAGPVAAVAPPPVYAEIARWPGDAPLADVMSAGRTCACTGEQVLAAALTHRRPLVGGAWARPTAALRDVNAVVRRFPAASAVAFLRAHEVGVVVQHPPLRGEPPPGVTCAVVDGHRACRLDR